MMQLHCLTGTSNYRMGGQFQFDVTLICLCFDFIRAHARCDSCSIVFLRFQVLQIKQILIAK